MGFSSESVGNGKDVVNMRGTGENGPETRRSHRQRRLGAPIVGNFLSPISLGSGFFSISAPSDLSDESDLSDLSDESDLSDKKAGADPLTWEKNRKNPDSMGWRCFNVVDVKETG
jgi:hypothetical protein